MRLLFILFLFFSYSLNASNYLFYVDNSNNKKVLTTISNIESVIDNANENSQIIFIIGDQNDDEGNLNYKSVKYDKYQLLDELEDYILDQKEIQNSKEILGALSAEITNLDVFDDIDNFNNSLKSNINISLFFDLSNFVTSKLYNKVVKSLLLQYNLINQNGIHPLCQINIYLESSNNDSIYLETIEKINRSDKNLNIYTY
tara:strand:- start:144 stop:746 length:603 start_codon:yes stop_codon:yes gene_type:complete